jgi:dGTP triphosphohydrolase
MRQIYEEKKSMIDLQQGVIINGCVAEDYPDSDVFGVIITPRCDIDNKKVSTIHYLPMVSLEDWLNNDYVKRYQKDARKKILNTMRKSLSDCKISTNILDGNLSTGDILKAAEPLSSNKKEYDKFKSDLDEYINLKDFFYCKNNISKWTEGKTFLNEICKWKNASYYILEDWDDETKYKIILLRDIRRLEFNLALRLKTGIVEQNLSDDDLRRNDIHKEKESTILRRYRTLAQIKSPFIEHIVQMFFYNFGRIGVDNHEDNLKEKIIGNLNKITKI